MREMTLGQMKKLLLLASALVAMPTMASADIIEADFSGTVNGMAPVFSSDGYTFTVAHFDNKPFTGDFIFDTSKGTLQDISPGVHQISDGLVSASLHLEAGGNCDNVAVCADLGVFTFVQSDIYWPPSMTWSDGGGLMDARVSDGSFYVFALDWEYQEGTCPAGPCGQFTGWGGTVTDKSVPVPGPIVGAGLPGLLALLALILGRRRPVI
jgi:hypothetical protein